MNDTAFFNADADMDPADIDRINREFYGRFNYPWLPLVLPVVHDPAFIPRFVCQEIGDFTGTRIPENGEIWVAGCGTNQAVITALRFPGAKVVGTDVSTRSLEVARRTADQLGLTNLELKEASLNDPCDKDRFDHVICTGVIHHNANPEIPLASLAQALKPSGVLELMVYNYYHRTQTTAYQKAIRILSGATGRGGLIDAELAMTAELIAHGGLPGSMAPFLAQQRDLPEPAVADSLLQPVEFSYTVDTLAAMCERAGLILLQPCVGQFDKLAQRFNWDPPLPTGAAKSAFERLGDLKRWQVANLLMTDASPMLWFYAQRGGHRPDRAQINADFLNRTFCQASCVTGSFILGADDRYSNSGRSAPIPAPAQPVDPQARAIFAACNGQTPMAEIFAQFSLPRDETTLTRLRVLLTTPAFPYLVAQ
jgi:SAM-dependent methyltransferase